VLEIKIKQLLSRSSVWLTNVLLKYLLNGERAALRRYTEDKL
jgi:hypothetical protein